MTAHYSPLSIVKLDLEPLLDGQVLVEMISAGLCGAQINEINAVKGQDKYLPHMMGHEGFGRVIQVGSQVTKVKPDDYVILHWRKGLGCECSGGRYKHNLFGTIGSGPVTTFSEKTIVSENRVSKINYEKDMVNLYPLIGCALSTSYGIVKNNILTNNKVLIIGAGGLGLAITFWLNVLHNIQPIIIDQSSYKKQFTDKFDVEFYSLDLLPNIFETLPKVDICIDTSGNTSMMSEGFNKLLKNGSLILVGQSRQGESLTIRNALDIFNNIKIFASDGGDFDPDEDLAHILDLVNLHRNLANNLISHTITLDQINDGIDMLTNGKAGRIIIKFKHEN